MGLSLESSSALLQATLGAKQSIANAFEHWQSAVDLDDLPSGQDALLPLLNRNLERLEIDHPWLPRLRGIYRKTWYANQVTLRSLASMVEALTAARQPTLVVGAPALAQTVYPEPALRPIFAAEIVVSPDAVDGALQTLSDLGWRPEPASTHLHSPEFRTWVASQRFVDTQGQVLWLWWHALADTPCPDLDSACFTAAQPLPLESTTPYTLAPTDHLLRACATANGANLIALADATLLIRQNAIDWPRLVTLASRHQLTLPVTHVLEMLASILKVPIPVESLDALQAVSTHRYAQRALQATWISPDQRSLLHKSWLHFDRFQRIAACQGLRAGPCRLAAYLQHTRHLDHPLQLPGQILRAAMP